MTGYCLQEVTWSDKGIMCDSCDQWYHTQCQGVGNDTYSMLADSKHVWYCLRCALPNYSTGLSDSLDTLSDSNLYDTLHLDNTTCSDFLDHPPQATSSSKPNKSPHNNPKQLRKKTNQRLVILNINCQSIKTKMPELHQVINQVKPDIIVGTESWLNPEINNSEIFPNNMFSIYRKDRTNRKGGGVFLAISNNIISSEQLN